MSQAILVPTRQRRGGPRVKQYSFSPGSLERLKLHVWKVPKAEGLLRAKLEGHAYIACGMGNEHYPEIEIGMAGHPANDDSAILVRAYEGDVEAATDLALEMQEHALFDWFDPCEAEGLDL